MRRRDASERALGERARHERKLRTLNGDRRAPQSALLLPGDAQQFLTGSERVGNGLFAPDVFTSFQRLPVQVLVLLHVREINQEVERFACEHGIDVRIVVRHFELFRLVARALGPDVAQAHDFHVRALGKHGQVRARDAAAPDYAGADAICVFAHGSRGTRGHGGAGEQSRFGELTTVQLRR